MVYCFWARIFKYSHVNDEDNLLSLLTSIRCLFGFLKFVYLFVIFQPNLNKSFLEN